MINLPTNETLTLNNKTTKTLNLQNSKTKYITHKHYNKTQHVNSSRPQNNEKINITPNQDKNTQTKTRKHQYKT